LYLNRFLKVGGSVRNAVQGLSLVGTMMLIMAGCTTMPVAKPPPAELEHQWTTHQQQLGRLQSWDVTGRLGIQTQDEGWHVSFHWEQGDAQLYHITLSGPLGQESAELQGTTQGVTLLTSDGHSETAQDPDALLLHKLGWRLPVKGLYYWIRGLPAPGNTETHGLDNQGRLQWLDQSGWHIAYHRYGDVAGTALPTKIFLDNPQVKVRMVITEWTLS
jgi:outer membrane lipoprotein LolB